MAEEPKRNQPSEGAAGDLSGRHPSVEQDGSAEPADVTGEATRGAASDLGPAGASQQWRGFYEAIRKAISDMRPGGQ